MFGPTCEVSESNTHDFEIYCYKEHKICNPDCCNCKYFAGSEMGTGICCLWDDDVEGEEHIVQHSEAYFEYLRIEEPEYYRDFKKAIEEGDLDLCKAWFGLD